MYSLHVYTDGPLTQTGNRKKKRFGEYIQRNATTQLGNSSKLIYIQNETVFGGGVLSEVVMHLRGGGWIILCLGGTCIGVYFNYIIFNLFK